MFQKPEDPPVPAGIKPFTFDMVQWKPGEVRAVREIAALMGWPTRTTYDTLREMESRGLIRQVAPIKRPSWETQPGAGHTFNDLSFIR